MSAKLDAKLDAGPYIAVVSLAGLHTGFDRLALADAMRRIELLLRHDPNCEATLGGDGAVVS